MSFFRGSAFEHKPFVKPSFPLFESVGVACRIIELYQARACAVCEDSDEISD